MRIAHVCMLFVAQLATYSCSMTAAYRTLAEHLNPSVPTLPIPASAASPALRAFLGAQLFYKLQVHSLKLLLTFELIVIQDI
jgi:hypothetical protein